MSPKKIDMGSAGSALLYMASSISVEHRPTSMDMKLAIVVFQLPFEAALPTNMLCRVW